MALRVQGHERSTKQIELHGELGRKVTINRAEHFVSGEDVFRIVLEVKDRDDVGFCNFFDLSVGPVALSIERYVELVVEGGVIEQSLPLSQLLWPIIEDYIFKVCSGGRIKCAQAFYDGILMSRRHHFFSYYQLSIF